MSFHLVFFGDLPGRLLIIAGAWLLVDSLRYRGLHRRGGAR